MIKVLKYGVVVALLITLVAGTIYIVARPTEARGAPESGEGRWSNDETREEAGGRWATKGGAGGQGRWTTANACEEDGCTIEGRQGQGQGQAGRTSLESQGGYRGGQSAGNSSGSGAGNSTSAGNGNGAGQGSGQANNNTETTAIYDWEILEGTVTVTGSELTVDTGETEVVVGLGQAWYREEASFEVEVGDQVRVEGYEEDSEFKAGTVENLTTNTTVTLRDATGRPMWAGRGNGQNRP
jgi:hypothetical protein